MIYSISRNPDEARKAARASEILGARDLALSVQVLGEFYVQATRASRMHPMSRRLAAEFVESFARFRVAELTKATVLEAVQTCQRFQISYWDAAILEAARSLDCEVVLSEDLSHGQDYDGVRVENPFR